MAGSTVLNTTLEFGILSIPVSVKSISEPKEVNFVRGTADGDKVKRQEVSAKVSDALAAGAEAVKALDADEVQRGVMVDDVFVPIPKEEIEKIEAMTKLDSMRIETFIPYEDVPFERTKGGYYLTPQKGQSKRTMKLLLDAMRPVYGPRGKVIRTARAAVCKLMPRSRQSLCVVYPKDDGLYVSVLHWAEDFSGAEAASRSLEGIVSGEAELSVARELIDALTGPVEIMDSMVDDMRALKLELMERAAAGEMPKVESPKVESPKAVEQKVASDNLMAALEQSLAAAKKPRARARA